MAKIINKIARISDLPESLVAAGKTVIAYNRENYAIDLSLIRGRKIEKIEKAENSDPSLPDVVTIYFSDKTRASFKVYNGTDGEIGETGDTGVKGNTGHENYVDTTQGNAVDQLKIINDIICLESIDDEEHDDSCRSAWSAYRGKAANIEIEKLNEAFMSDAEYNVLYNEEETVYIDAEFTTTKEDESVIIFNTDTNPHTKYTKVWTWEESEVATYYIAIYGIVYKTDKDGKYIIDEETGEKVPMTDEEGNIVTEVVRYDPVSANLWDDIYLGATEGYFAATTAQLSDGTQLYYYDAKTGQYEELEVINTMNDNTNQRHEYSFKHYDETLESYINVFHNYLTSAYVYSLDAVNIAKDVYEAEVGSNGEVEYKLVDISTIDVNVFATYYEKVGDKYVEIDDISEYIATKPERWFAKEDDGKFHEVESEDDIDKDAYQEYIRVTIDSLAGVYTFHRWNPVTVYEETSYVESEVAYDNTGVQLYIYTENREYFTSKLVTKVDEQGNATYENEYTKILIPDWITAEFTTTDEDENTLILNTVHEIPGDEDNSEIDTTAEDYEPDDEELVPVQFVTAGELPTIYEKSGDTYTETTIERAIEENKIFYSNSGISIVGDYWINSDKLLYTPISGADVQSYQVVYCKVGEAYKVWKGSIDHEATYYIGTEQYEKLQPSMLTEHEIILFAGIPQQLPITFYPLDSNNKKAVIEYDSEMITFYEDGRIASMEENGDTDICIEPETGADLHIHVILMTRVASLITREYGLDKDTIIIDETANLRALPTPYNASNRNVDFEQSNDNIVISNIQQPSGDNNIVSATVTGKKQGTTTIWLTANDGYGADAQLSIEVVDVVTEVKWNAGTADETGTIIHVPETYYDRDSAWAYNNEHGYREGDEGYVNVGDLKDHDYYKLTILRGVTYELSLTSTPADSAKSDITWTKSDDITIEKAQKQITHEATEEDVDNGLADEIGQIIVDDIADVYMITGNVAGTYQISGENAFSKSHGQANTKIDLTVEVIQSVDKITVTPSNLSFNKGTKKKFIATIEPDTADNKTFTWESSNEEVMTVSADGIVTAVSTGTAELRAKAKDGSGVIGTASISITEPLSSISFAKNGEMIYVGIDNTETINAVTVFDGESTSPQLIWKSADESIATVTGSGDEGTITGKKLGSTIIMAIDSTNSGIMATIQINVIRLATSLSFGEGFNSADLNVGDMFVLVPEFNDSDEAPVSIQVVNYSSSDDNVSTVSSTGIVTAIATGTAVITATTTDGSNLSAECTINVNE